MVAGLIRLHLRVQKCAVIVLKTRCNSRPLSIVIFLRCKSSRTQGSCYIIFDKFEYNFHKLKAFYVADTMKYFVLQFPNYDMFFIGQYQVSKCVHSLIACILFKAVNILRNIFFSIGLFAVVKNICL